MAMVVVTTFIPDQHLPGGKLARGIIGLGLGAVVVAFATASISAGGIALAVVAGVAIAISLMVAHHDAEPDDKNRGGLVTDLLVVVAGTAVVIGVLLSAPVGGVVATVAIFALLGLRSRRS